MRGHADSETAGASAALNTGGLPRELFGADARQVANRLAAATASLLLAVALSGGLRSPLVPLLAAALIAYVRYEPRRAVLLAPPLSAVLLLLLSAWRGQAASGLAVAVLLVLATGPGMWWRREARRTERRLELLDEILIQARAGRTGEAPSAAQELADLELALHAVSQRVGASSVVLWSVDSYRGVARPRAGSAGRPGVTVWLSGDPMGWAWDNGTRLRIEEPPRWAEQDVLLVMDRIRRHGDHGDILTYGFPAGVEAPQDERFDETAVYVRGILALQEARADAAADKRRLRILMHGLGRTPGEQDIENFAPELCTAAADLVDGTGAAIGFWYGDHGTVLASIGEDGGPRAGDIFSPPASELALAIRADAILVRGAGDWSLGRTHLAHPQERWQARPRCLAAVPLRSAAGVIGVLAVWSSRVPSFQPEPLELLSLMGPYAAVHLHHAREYGSIKETAERDPLTHLRNRRAFEDVFAAESARYERYGRPLSLLVIDLDHFKNVNDRHGHEAGDEVLRRTARVIQTCVRDVDTAARLGGEEFVVLMPETSLRSAMEAAERIRAAVAASPVDWHGTSIPVHASLGVAAAPELVATPAELIASADAALYVAKGEGRNRVVAAEKSVR
jgi:diguanylate cyclase (GGDEF)-like protein